MKLGSILLAFGFAISCGGRAAADDSDLVWVFGLGDTRCEQMTEAAQRFRETPLVYESYIDGFITALTISLPTSTNAFAGTDSISRYALVLQYCESHPGDLL